MTDGVRRLSPSRLATYATCPRQYEYEYVWRVETPEESRRYLDRGLAYHAVVERTCDDVRDATGRYGDAEIRQLARSHLATEWRDRIDRSEYHSDAQYEYDRALVASAIDSFFEDDGLVHARNSLRTEQTVTLDRDGRHYLGRVDHIVRTDDGLHVYDYKGSLSGIVSGYWAPKIPGHRSGEEFIADYLKDLFQAAIYVEGAKALDVYEPGMAVEFSFYGLLDSKTRTGSPDGLQVAVSGKSRDVTWIYEKYRDDIWALVEACYDGITAEQYEPVRFDEIREHACDDCEYRAMCADYLNAEVRIDD